MLLIWFVSHRHCHRHPSCYCLLSAVPSTPHSNPSREQDPHVTGGEHEAHGGEQAAQAGHGLLGRSHVETVPCAVRMLGSPGAVPGGHFPEGSSGDRNSPDGALVWQLEEGWGRQELGIPESGLPTSPSGLHTGPGRRAACSSTSPLSLKYRAGALGLAAAPQVLRIQTQPVAPHGAGHQRWRAWGGAPRALYPRWLRRQLVGGRESHHAWP